MPGSLPRRLLVVGAGTMGLQVAAQVVQVEPGMPAHGLAVIEMQAMTQADAVAVPVLAGSASVRFAHDGQIVAPDAVRVA